MGQIFTRLHLGKPVFYLLTVLCMAAGAQRAAAQCTGPSGTISVGPTGTYSTLTAAIAATSTGISASVIFELQSSYTSTGETFPLTFPANACLTSTRTITVRPASGATGLSITSANTTATIDINGGNYIIIDGRPGGTGTTSQLTIANTGTTSSSAIRFINDASNNTVRYCSLQGSAATSLGVVSFSTGTVTGNSNNTISNNDIGPAGSNQPINGIYSLGTSTAVNAGNVINANNIFDYFSAGSASNGLNINSNNSGWTITNNKLYQTAERVYTSASTHNGIGITSGAGYTITGNIIGYANAAGTGTTNMIGNSTTLSGFPGSYTTSGTANATRYVAINCGFTAAGANSAIQNNTIAGFALYSSSGASTTYGVFCGIQVTAGNASITGNTIGATTGTGSIYTATSTTAGTIVGIYATSANTVSIQTNVIGALDAMGNSATISGGVTGINSAGAGTFTISGNTIGNSTNPNMRMGNLNSGTNLSNASSATFGAASGTGTFTGILSSASGVVTMSGNTIRNASLNSTATGSSFRGINNSAGTVTIIGNLINNITSSNTNTTVSTGLLAGAGILNQGGNTGCLITQNTINTLSLTNTTSTGTNLAGISIAALSLDVTRNKIYDLSNASTSTTATTPGTASGIFIRSGTASVNDNIINNMISLGNGQTNNTTFFGIWANHGSSPNPNDNIYYNTINIEGSVSSGSMPSFAFHRGNLATSVVNASNVDIRNNIFNNSRSGGTSKNYAIGNYYGATATATGWGTNASNYNALNAASANVGYWNADLTFSGWQTAAVSDANSVSNVSVLFVNTALGDLHMNFGTTATRLESGGTPITGVTTDYDNQTRPGPSGSTNGGGCATDIGADEFDGVPLDVTGPSITYTPLMTTACTSSGTRVFSGVVITDCSNINITTGTKPRVYYKKSTDNNTYAGNTSSDNGWKFVEASNSASPFSFTIDYTKLQGGTVSTGDIIQYFVVAQDLVATPNVGINSGTFTATPSSVALTSAAFPIGGTINSFNIVSSGLSGTVTIGATGTYTSLTGTGGLFNALNTSGLTSNVTASIIDASITESGTVALNAIANSGCASGPFTLTIKPAATVTSTLSGSSAAAIIKLNGADNVIIDGSNNGTSSQNLTISNTNTATTSGVIWLASTASGDGATGNTVKNCIVTGNAATTTLAGIISSGSVYGGAAEGANTGNTYTNNTVSLAQYGIGMVGPSTMESGAVVTNNSIGTAANAIGFRGVFVSNQNGAQVTGNTIQNIQTSGSAASGLLLAGTTDLVNVSANSISNVNSTATSSGVNSVSAIAITAATQTNTTIDGNNITGIQSSATGGYGVRAIIVQGSGTTVSNNMLSDIYNYQDATVTSYATTGISIDGNITGVKLYNNSVNLYGSHTGYASNTTGGVATCLYINSTAAAGLDVRNNIFTNSYDNSTSTGDKSYAIYSLSSASVFSNINNNGYFVSGTGTPVLGFLGSDLTTLAQIQSAFGGNTASVNASPVYVSNTNLHLTNTLGANWCFNGSGATIPSITADIDLQPRGTPPDMGADEFVAVDNTTLTPASQTVCSGTAITSIVPAGTATSFSWTRDNTATVTGIAASGTGTISGTLTNTSSAPVTITFTVTPLNATGCPFGSTVTATVVVNPIPAATATPASQTVCTGAAITTIANTSNVTGATFAWVRNNTATVTGLATSGSGNISGTPINGTAAAVTVTFTITPSYTNGATTCTGTATTATAIVNPVNTATLSSATGTNAQTVCINSPITAITYATTGATGATFSGLPVGVSGVWAGNVATISGIPTASGSFSYTVTLTGGCGTVTATGNMTVTPNNTATLSSAAGTDAQSVCTNSAITNITYATTGATGATFSGLPAGVSGVWAGNVATISGTPTASGIFNYTVTLTGGCGTVTAAGSINSISANTIALSSAAGTNAQSVCVNAPITSITYNTTTTTGATFSGLPAGVSGVWAGNVVTISGTPTASGAFTYTVTLTGGCGTVTSTGMISVINSNTIALSSAAGTNAQSPCINTAITNITYATTGATGATFSGLPVGVSGTWASNVATISGTPTVAGPFTYTVTLTGGCGAVLTANGTITVKSNNTVTLSSAAPTAAQTVCANSAITGITYTTTGATGASFSGLPAGVSGAWAGNVATISGTPTVAGSYTYTVMPTGGCGTVSATGTITVNPNNSATLSSATGTNVQTICINTPLTNITYATTGATGATFSGLPAGVSGTWAANTITISGTPTASGTFSYSATLTGGSGCGGTVTVNGTINVSPNNTVSLSSATGTNAQSPCVNTAIANIIYGTTGATGATFSGLPAGVSGTWASNVATISGTPTVVGPFSYTVTLTGGCGIVTAAGTVTVRPNNTVSLSSATGTNAQTVCINTALTNITYNTTGATGANFTGLPTGVSGTWAGNVATISGIPAIAGTSSYTVTLTGGCSVVTTTGTITVSPNNTITLTSGAPSATQTRCQNVAIGNITYATTGATGANVTGLPPGVNGVWSGNVVTISGTPTVAGSYTYTVIMTGGCGGTAASGTILVNALPTVSISPASAAVICSGSGITLTASGASTYVWTPATGLSATTGTSVVANPSASTTYFVNGTDGNGCVSSASKLVTVNGLPTVSISPAAPIAFCQGQSVTLTASGAATYVWTPTTGLSAGTGISVVASPAITTTYTVTGTAGNGCTATATKTITIIPAPDPTITPGGYVNICQFDSVQFKAVAGYAGYEWRLYGVLVSTGTPAFTTGTGGFYTLKVTDANGCSATSPAPAVVTITQRPVPVIKRTGQTLDAGATYSSYQWYAGSTAISGATGRTYTPSVAGAYSVAVTDTTALHCAGISQPYNAPVGVNGNSVQDEIHLYPNPSADRVFISAPVPVNVTISSMEGKQLFTGRDVREINLGAYADGVYRVLISDNAGHYLKTEKITKLTR